MMGNEIVWVICIAVATLSVTALAATIYLRLLRKNPSRVGAFLYDPKPIGRTEANTGRRILNREQKKRAHKSRMMVKKKKGF